MKTYLALRKKNGEGVLGLLTSYLIKLRLVTKYPHAGIVVDGILYDSSTKEGVGSSKFEEDGWELFELPESVGKNTLKLFETHKGGGYDWWSLLAFVMLPVRDSKKWYCYEWCYQCMTNKAPRERVNPEDLLILAISKNKGE